MPASDHWFCWWRCPLGLPCPPAQAVDDILAGLYSGTFARQPTARKVLEKRWQSLDFMHAQVRVGGWVGGWVREDGWHTGKRAYIWLRRNDV